MVIVILFTIIYKVLFFFTGDKYVRSCIWFNCRYLCSFLLAICLIRKRLHGREKLDKNATYVFVSNHVTQFDTIVAASSVPHPVSFVAKSELLKIPFFGTMVQMLAIPVDRKNKQSRERSRQLLLDHVSNKDSVFLYPEGTRNRTTQPLIGFKDGAFSTAILTKTPIAVITLVGMNKINEAKGLQLLPGIVDVHFSDPIATTDLTIEDLDSLKKTVADIIVKILKTSSTPQG